MFGFTGVDYPFPLIKALITYLFVIIREILKGEFKG